MWGAEAIKQLLRRMGIEARRFTVQTSPDAQLGRILQHFRIDLVLDVGAYDGTYARRLRRVGYRGRIVSFEPLSEAYKRLVQESLPDPAWEVAPRMALGARNGEAWLNVSGHPMSSSLRDMLPLHMEAVPGSAVAGRERVALARLDSVARPYLQGAERIFVKMDAQGWEDEILEGAQGVLERMTAIQTELSFAALYADQPLFDVMRQRLHQCGFELFAIFPGHVYEATGQTLQVDGIFVRRSLS